MDQNMLMFKELVNEFIEARNIDWLKLLKAQVDGDIVRIGKECRLIEKHNILSKAISELTKRF